MQGPRQPSDYAPKAKKGDDRGYPDAGNGSRSTDILRHTNEAQFE
jgi:hypothetical protein